MTLEKFDWKQLHAYLPRLWGMPSDHSFPGEAQGWRRTDAVHGRLVGTTSNTIGMPHLQPSASNPPQEPHDAFRRPGTADGRREACRQQLQKLTAHREKRQETLAEAGVNHQVQMPQGSTGRNTFSSTAGDVQWQRWIKDLPIPALSCLFATDVVKQRRKKGYFFSPVSSCTKFPEQPHKELHGHNGMITEDPNTTKPSF